MKNSDLPAHEVFDSLRSQRHRNRQTRGLPHIMRIAGYYSQSVLPEYNPAENPNAPHQNQDQRYFVTIHVA